MAQIMNDEQRLAALEAYNPKDHLISVGKTNNGQPVLYYPAAWRLYEMRLRYPHFTLEAEIVHMDEDKGTVIIKAIGYDGLDYASSNLKGTALKQGKIMELDKVETKAKSRVVRDIGIGTEYALDMDADETDATHNEPQQARASKPPVQRPQPVQAPRPMVAPVSVPQAQQDAPQQQAVSTPVSLSVPTVKELQARCKELFGAGQWAATKVKVIGGNIPDDNMTPEQQSQMHKSFENVAAKRLAKAS